MRIVSNPVMYVVVYLGLMVPTYVLPYFGSNSVTAVATREIAGALTGVSTPLLHLPFYLHLACLLGLCALTFLRGQVVRRTWLLVFPFLALVFDMTPVLSWVPLVPTVMHLLAVILAVAGVEEGGKTRVSVAVN